MSYTRLVGYAVLPVLLVVGGLSNGGADGGVIALFGAIVLAFVLARFFDVLPRRR